MKLKLDAEGKVVLQDGKPVYVADDGKEFAFDAPQMYGKITALTKESGEHRARAEAAEAKLEAFKDITDPAAALKALTTIKNLDDKKLVDAGEVEKIKSEVSKGYETKLAEAKKAQQDLEQQLFDEMVGGAFSRSKFIAEKVAIPADLLQARFGSHFGIKDGKVYGTDANGQDVYSKTRLGELADFDEAIEIIVSNYAQKDSILKGANASGGGAHGNNFNGHGGGKRTITRSQWESLPEAERSKAGKDYTLVDG